MITTKHTVSYCELCETDMIVCVTCGNNCCNGGDGKVDGAICVDCPDAYVVQEEYWKDPTNVHFESTTLA